jgi:hypothetical protein
VTSKILSEDHLIAAGHIFGYRGEIARVYRHFRLLPRNFAADANQ